MVLCTVKSPLTIRAEGGHPLFTQRLSTKKAAENPAAQRVKKVAYATFLNFALTHWSNGEAVLPAVRSCKEAFRPEKHKN